MPEQTGQERTEEATLKRRIDARKKGTVARSVELTSSLVLIVLLLAMPLAVGLLGKGFVSGFTSGMRTMPTDAAPANILRYCLTVAQPCVAGLGVILAIALVLGVASNVAQVGFVISGEALTPNFAKMNPLEGFKRLLSANAVFDAGKALLKSLLFGFLAYSTVAASWGTLLGLGAVTAPAGLAATGEIARAMAFKVVVVWMALAGADYFVQRRRVSKMLRMTKEEVKQEMRQQEQSPEIRGVLVRKRRQMARGRMMQNLKRADVVITNPTHYAVALVYDHQKQSAPIVVAKGADILAARIREVAKEHQIPIVPNPPLARALYRQCELGDIVPKDLFQPVAEVLAYVYKTIKKVR
ncbi:MAG: EscU/YscU/HrcU family type III secretion system export apparatus switch protein [Fimbriimonadaceae bacterium]